MHDLKGLDLVIFYGKRPVIHTQQAYHAGRRDDRLPITVAEAGKQIARKQRGGNDLNSIRPFAALQVRWTKTLISPFAEAG